MTETLSAYLLRRAEEETACAARAAQPIAADIHRRLANEYRERAAELGVAPISAAA